MCAFVYVCVCVLELAEQCFPFLIRVAQTPAAGSMEGERVCEYVCVCVCICLKGSGVVMSAGT